MSDLKQIWQPIELLTVKNRLLLIRLENKVNSLHLDPQWEKVMGDGQILFEFNPGEAKEFELIGTVKEWSDDVKDSLKGTWKSLTTSSPPQAPSHEEGWYDRAKREAREAQNAIKQIIDDPAGAIAKKILPP